MISVIIHEHHSVNPYQDIVQTTQKKRKKSSIYLQIVDSHETNLLFILRRKIHFLCKEIPKKNLIGTVLYIVLSILAGTLIVCLTTRKTGIRFIFNIFMNKILSIVFEQLICDRSHRPTIAKSENLNSHPQSVAIAQFNNDQYLDFVVVNKDLNTFDIYLGQNNGTFEYHKTYSTGLNSSPYSVLTANFDNRDGIDLAVAHFGSNSIGIYLGLNNGSFIPRKSFSTGSSRPLFIAVNDLNNDHHVDIVVVNSGTHSIGIYFGLGDGSFLSSMIYSTGFDSFPCSLGIVDLNDDHHLDMIVANSGTNNIGLFFGYGNGRFKDQMIYSTGFESNPSSVAIDDLNKDHYMDIVVANPGRSNIKIFFGDKNGDLSREVSYSMGLNSHPSFIGINDVNGDDQLDVIVVDSINEKVNVLPGDENGSFLYLSVYIVDVGSNPVSFDSADLNNANKSDIVVVNRGTNAILLLREYEMKYSLRYNALIEGNLAYPILIVSGDVDGDDILDIISIDDSDSDIWMFRGYGNGSFERYTRLHMEDPGVTGIALSDLNNDNRVDIVVVNYINNSLGILFGYGNGEFSEMMRYSSESAAYPTSLVIGDMNKDNCMDIITTSVISDIIGIYIGDCNGTLELFTTYRTDPTMKATSIIIDDFNDDNNEDIAIGYFTSTGIMVYFGDGNGWLSTSEMYPLGLFAQSSIIASGDFNNDNRADLIVVLGGTNEIVSFLSNVNNSLTSIGTYLLQSCRNPKSIVVGDLNKDNQLDVVLSCFNSDNLAVLIGNNNGEYWSEISYWIGINSSPGHLTSGDFNNDNQIDIAVVAYDSTQFAVFMSDYEADFDVERKYSLSSGSQPISVAIGDFNSDNVLDLVVLNSGKENIGIRLGLGNGSFGIEKVYSTGRNSNPKYVHLYDVNRDRHLDILVANSQNNSVLILLGNGHGTFERTLRYSMDFHSKPVCVAVADLNDDQWPDLIVGNQGIDNLEIVYLYNYASFVLHQTYFGTSESYPRIISVVDMNNDKQLDIVVLNYSPRSVDVYFGHGNGSFTIERIYVMKKGSNPTQMTVADLNNDGWLDLIISHSRAQWIDVILADGNGHFKIIVTSPIKANSNVAAMIVDDVNNDDRLDLILAYENKNRNTIEIYLGFGNGSLLSTTTYLTDFNAVPYSIVLGDLNNDTYLDIVVAYGTNDSIGVFQGYGNGSFASQTIYQFGELSGPVSVALGDLNNDGQFDIVVANTSYHFIRIYLGFGNGSFSKRRGDYMGTDCLPTYVKVDDFNEDNRADIAVICARESAIIILFGTEKDDFLKGRKYFTTSTSIHKTIAFGDFNNDSYLDFAVGNTINSDIDIYLRNGTELFGNPTTLPMGSYAAKPNSLILGDFDHDNQSDIVVATYQSDYIIIFYSTEVGMFWSGESYFTGDNSNPHAVVAGHFDEDDHLDIAVVNAGTNEVMIFQGHGDRLFTMIGSYSTGTNSIPHSIAVSDFNNDKRPDIAVTNAGANNILILFGLGNGTFGNERSHSLGYNSRPYSIAVGDFNNDSWIDMAVTNFGADYVEILLQIC